MKFRAILATLLFLLATLPIAPQEVVSARRRAASAGTAVAFDSQAYYASGTLTTCVNAQDPASSPCVITTSYAIPTSGDAAVVVIWGCWNPGCSSTNSGTLSLTDGTNTYTLVSAASQNPSAFFTYVYVSCGATSVSGATLSFLDTGSGGESFNYMRAQYGSFKNAHSSGCTDSAVSAVGSGSSVSPSITSAGNVTNAGEAGIAAMNCAGLPVNTGTYTTMSTDSTDNMFFGYKTSLTQGSTTTATITCSSGGWLSSIIALQP